VEEAFKEVNEAEATQIELVGHADTAEKTPNEISSQRATAVRNELARLGLSGKVTVYISGVGAAKPVVRTKADVREPLNRYVSISFR